MQDMAITTFGLTRRFGKMTAVDNLALRVPRGSVYGFLGPNGAGKTTTIRMLLGLIRPHAGEVHLLGEPLPRRRMAVLPRIGALVESPSLYPNLTGRENLEVTRRLIDAPHAHIERVLRIVHLESAAGRQVQGYSMGMRQRLGIALALLNDPELLILDEPSNGLDPSGMQEMRELITHLSKDHGCTILLSSHLLTEVEQVATHIGIVQNGRLLIQGTLDDLHAQTEDHLVLGVEQVDQAQALLQQAGWSVQRNGSPRLTVATNGRSDVALINNQLVRAGLNVFHLSLAQPTLEDIFVTLTHTKGAK
jgi:ABC-2 type transport system ATP-binding protein